VLINVDIKEKKDVDELKARKNIRDAEKKLGKKGRVLVRYSGTQNLCRVMIEGENEKEIGKMSNDIAKAIKKEIGV
jgi:phosphoglucosamine mutase